MKRTRILWASILCLGLHGAAGASAGVPVSLEQGELVAQVRADGVVAYKGIPYARAERWRPPQPAAGWRGVRAADHAGPACAQNPKRLRAGVQTVSEDCLSLDVFSKPEWVAAARPARPVMVQIHGGSFKWGSGGEAQYDGAAFVRDGVILVNINYRLGRFGRFAHPDMSRQQAGEWLANYGLMDQIAALQWVRRNIARFGGDPGNVTIFGCSAGGVSTTLLMTSPPAKGLFQRAIAQSGGVALEGGQEISADHPFAPGLEKDGLKFAASFGIAAGTADTLRALRALSMDAIIDYDAKDNSFSTNPVVDGAVVPDQVGRIFDQGRQHRVPFLAGSADWEDSLLGRAALTNDFFLAPVKPDWQAFTAALPGATTDEMVRSWFRDGAFIAPARFLTDRMSRVQQPGYAYLFSYLPKDKRGQQPGAAHCSENAYLFDNAEGQAPSADPQGLAQDRRFAALIRGAWTSFAKTGKPQLENLPAWPAFDFGADTMLGLDEPARLVKAYQESRMTYYRQRTERRLRAPLPEPAAPQPKAP